MHAETLEFEQARCCQVTAFDEKGARFLRTVGAGEGFSGSALSNEQSILEGVRCISFCRGFMSNISVLRGNCGSEIGNFAQTLFVRLFELTSRPEGA